MLWYVVSMFLFNLTLGATAGFVVELRRNRRPRRQVDEGAETDAEATDASAEEAQAWEFDASQPSSQAAADIPQEWLDALESEAIESKTFVEASVQVLRLEVGRYREALVHVERQIRQCAAAPAPTAVQGILNELRTLNADWLAKQTEAADFLSDRRGGLGDFEEVGGKLEDVLLDQRAQIETTCSNIDVLNFETNPGQGCDRLMTEVMRLLALAHSLRDRMQDAMMIIMRADRRLEGVDKKTQRDGLTGLFSRTGLEVILHEWWRDDIARQRLVSMALLDLDHFGRLNEQIGTHACDALLEAVGRLFDELVPKDRCYNRALRIEGPIFALFCGDAGPRNAMSAVERIRQSFQESSFLVDEIEHQVTMSCSVTEVQKDDTPDTLLKRLKVGLRGAKRNGRNCTMLDEGEGPTLVEAPEFQVKGHLLRVGDQLEV